MRGGGHRRGQLHVLDVQQHVQRHGLGPGPNGGSVRHLHARAQRFGLAPSELRAPLADPRPHGQLRQRRRWHVGQLSQHVGKHPKPRRRSARRHPLDVEAREHRHRWHCVVERELQLLRLRLQLCHVRQHKHQHQQLLLEPGRGGPRIGTQLWRQPHPLVRMARRRHRQLLRSGRWMQQRPLCQCGHHHELLPHHLDPQSVAIPPHRGTKRLDSEHVRRELLRSLRRMDTTRVRHHQHSSGQPAGL